MQHYFCRLISPRPTFQADMTADERAIMIEHVAYWTELAERGVAIAFGPVADPAGGYGVSIIRLPDGADAHNLERGDPVVKSGIGFRYEISPMPRVVIPSWAEPPAR